MADGSSIKSDGFIAYQDQEDGLGFQIASKLANPATKISLKGASGDAAKRGANSYRLTSPRVTAADTLAALIGYDAQRAIVPLQNDQRGYNKETLSTLIDFKDYMITGEECASDSYVLAVPSAMVYELGESAFPSAYGSGAVGALPRNLQAQTALRRRIETVYVTADTADRCRAAVEGFRAQGMNVVRLPDNANPYRDVLNIAYERLDPDRVVETGFNEQTNSRTRVSKIRGANYGKGLVGVLLPSDVAWMGEGKDYHPEARDVAMRDTDYVIVDQGLAGAKPVSSHFLVLERKTEKTGKDKKKHSESPVDKIAGDSGLVASKLASIGLNTEKNVRVLLKVDTRGPGVKDTAILTKLMTDKGLRHTPIILNDRPDTLPTVYEIAVHSDEDRKALHKVLSAATNSDHGWQPRVLGAFVSSRTMPDAPEPAHPNNIFMYLLLGSVGLCIAILTVLAVRPDVRDAFLSTIFSAF